MGLHASTRRNRISPTTGMGKSPPHLSFYFFPASAGVLLEAVEYAIAMEIPRKLIDMMER